MNESSSSSAVFLNQFDIEVPDRKLYFRIGYKSPKAEIPDQVKALVEDMRRLQKKLLRPRAVYKVIDYQETNRHPVFKDSEKVALCLCTIGSQLERQSRLWMQENQLLKGFILDSFGSEAAEVLAGKCDGIIAGQAMKMGLWPSKRFSPGYGEWDIREQKYVFETLPAGEIGVRLSDSCMMIPRKSVSFRINFYRKRDLTTRKF